MKLPELTGAPIEVRFAPSLSAHHGKLLTQSVEGHEIHAASFIRQRVIVLDAELRQRPAELNRIFAHELAHFAWVRLGNAGRRAFEKVIAGEEGVQGELGWSAESRKRRLGPRDRKRRTRRWREYVCESFCDSAGWLFGGARSAEYTLPARARARRRRWFDAAGLLKRIPV